MKLTGQKTRSELQPGKTFTELVTEATMIVFSVLLALALGELASSIHESSQTNNLLTNLGVELKHNQEAVQEQYRYHLRVLHTIDSALTTPSFQQQIVVNGEFNLQKLAPQGVLYRDLEDVAWEVAKSNNISSRVDVELITLFTRVAVEQEKINRVETAVADIILSPESRQSANTRQTLLLLRDTYRGWAVDRVPSLLKTYQQALAKLNEL